MRLPLSTAAPIAPASDLSPVGTTAPSADVSPAGLNGVRILLVDDEADGREMLARILSDCGAVTTLASCAEEAVTKSQRMAHDLLISDIGMPGHDGYELRLDTRAGGHAGRAVVRQGKGHLYVRPMAAEETTGWRAIPDATRSAMAA